MTYTLNRRGFLRSSAAAVAGLSMISSTGCATAPRGSRRPAPSERINLALIGFGTIAQSTTPNFLADERVQIVAVADPVSELPHYGYSGELTGGRLVGQRVVEQHYAQQAAGVRFKGCRVYRDFREMLENEDVDAVNISTPDHWHYGAAVFAARRGKHIYGQKPFALGIRQGRRIVEEVARAGVTWQTGSQQRSEAHFRIAAEFIRNGRIGKVTGIKVGLPGGRCDWSKPSARSKPEAPPKELDFDLWLGPAPDRPYGPPAAPAELAAQLGLLRRHDYRLGRPSHRYRAVGAGHGPERPGPHRERDRCAAAPDRAVQHAHRILLRRGISWRDPDERLHQTPERHPV